MKLMISIWFLFHVRDREREWLLGIVKNGLAAELNQVEINTLLHFISSVLSPAQTMAKTIASNKSSQAEWLSAWSSLVEGDECKR